MQSRFFKIIIILFFVTFKGFTQTEEKVKDSINPVPAYSFDNSKSGTLYLNNPTEKVIEYDYTIGKYIIRQTIGKSRFNLPKYLTEEEYKNLRLKQDIHEYFREKNSAIEGRHKDAKDGQKNLLPSLYVNNSFFESIFGGTEISMTPRGAVTLRLGVLYQNLENPLLSEENQRSYTPEFDQQIRASLSAKVGERLTADINYDTQSTFSFQNQVKLEYTPGEDDLLRSIEVGNVNMNINNNLISGAQSLFGVKAQMQFGDTKVTGVFSQQQSQTKNIVAEGGGALTEFELKTTQYDANKHFFISQYFRNNYNDALESLPLINSSIQITKLEVWVTNRSTNTQEVRNIVGLVDLGESGTDVYDNSVSNISSSNVTETSPSFIPRNEENSLSTYVGSDKTVLRNIQDVPSALSFLDQGTDYSIVENARKLTSTEYTYHPQLGYLSLNSSLSDGDVLAIAFEYTRNGETYKVGELSTDGIENTDNLVVKLIRPQLINTSDVVWNLHMKNVYNLGAYNLEQDGFTFGVLYRDDERGQATNNLLGATEDAVKEKTLLNITKVDRLDSNNNLTTGNAGDGFFDFVEGLTVNSQNGTIIFPVIEPFGRDLESVLANESDKDDFVFNELYTTTASVAENDYQDKDKFLLSGFYTSSSSNGISLGAFNVPPGSVTVTSGGIPLIEGVDYTVDYFGGTVKIINPAIESSGQAINVSLENNTFFNQQQKTYMGVDVEHKFSDELVVGATVLNVNEQPISNKVQYGQDPINNTMFGVNFDYSAEVSELTDLVNYLPNIDTDAPSKVSVRGDFAYLLPGTSSSIDIGGEATTYIDDFEGAEIPISMSTSQSWYLSSVPVDFEDRAFGEASVDDIESGKKRAKLAWYNVDQLFYGESSLKPSSVDDNELSRAEVRPIATSELFPERNLDATQRINLQTLDLSYYPNERGPYNYEDAISATNTTELNNPEENWGGITRGLLTTDFQNANIQYVEFWLQDPYQNYSINTTEGIVRRQPTNEKGTLYINLGSISEDILKDNRKVFENGFPEDGDATDGVSVSKTNVANIPISSSLLYAFEENDTARENQDIGYDGMSDTEEAERLFTLGVDQNLLNTEDPSSDNFRFFRGTDYDNENASILKRYKDYNNTQGNSPTASLYGESYPTSATNNPDVEDANRDQTMNTVDAYWQYKVDLSQNNLSKFSNEFIVDELETTVTLENETEENFKWYLFRIPISAGTAVGDISGFQSIHFMRMFLTDFEIPVTLRMAEFQLVRGDWRIYDQIIQPDDELVDRGDTIDGKNTVESGVVSVEENESRVPVNYVLPPTITRESLQGTSSVLQQNEQSLTINVESLEEEKTVGVYKNVGTDMRMFKKIKMFIHAEELAPNTVDDDDLVAVIRMGSDVSDNYYQIEIPLKMTDIPNFGASNLLENGEVWPEENYLDVSLTDLTAVKLKRDGADNGSDLTTELYPLQVDNTQTALRVKGSPNLSNIRTIFMGVKNLDAVEKDVEVWFNELRLVGFDNDGGWATQVFADANIADFASVSVNGAYQSIGFGDIEQSVNERSQEEVKSYSLNTNVNVGQLLPNNWNVNLPLNYSISEEVRTPKYDPKYEDVLSEDSKEINTNSDYVDVTSKRRGISLMNVKKERSRTTDRKPKVYDIENFSASYAYTDEENESYTIEKDLSQTVNLSGNYAFTFKPIKIEPLKKVPFLQNKAFSLLKDFNFNLLPNNIAINGKIQRSYSEYKTRDLLEAGEGSIDIPTLKQRNYMFDWDYRIGYQLTSALNLNFTANTNRIFDAFEHDDTDGYEDRLEKINLYSDFFNIGRANRYNQTLTANYNIPIHKLPLLGFATANYSYKADFTWQATSPSYFEEIGNSIQNGSTHNLTTTLNFEKFYKTIGLKKLFGKSKKRKVKSKTPNLGRIASKKSDNFSIKDFTYNLLTSLKTVRLSYNDVRSTSLDGYSEEVGLLGLSSSGGGYTPGLGFVFGQQDSNFARLAAANDWLNLREEDANVYSKSFNLSKLTDLSYDVTVKPLKDLNIQLNASRGFSERSSQQIDYVNRDGSNTLEEGAASVLGNFNMSYSLAKTSFGSDAEELFNTFEGNRNLIYEEIHPNLSTELAEATSDEDVERLNTQALNSQEVLIHSFLAAYSGNSVASTDRTIFKAIPIPNWKLTYRGLMRLGFIKRNFSSFTMSHGYSSSYTINSFSNNLDSSGDNPFLPDDYIYSGITLTDAFSPLIKLDFKLKNSLSLRGTVNSSRTLALNLNNITVSEANAKEYAFGFGYRIKDVQIKTRFLKKKRVLKGDVNIQADVSYKTDLTTIRTVGEETAQSVGGQNILAIKVAADYNLSKSFVASLYYDQSVASYAISTLYPRQSINAGFSLVYNLGN